MDVSPFAVLLLQLSVLLGVAIVGGQVARRFGQPAVVGEIVGGLLIGVTVAGALAPGVFDWLFVASAEATTSRQAVVNLGMLFFLFVAGCEVDLTDLRSIGPKALAIGAAGTFVPLAAGAALVFALPEEVWGSTTTGRLPLALFVGVNLANSANPVLARILVDLDLMKTEVGSISMTATIVDDLVNWSVFAVLVSTSAPEVADGSSNSALGSVLAVIGLVVVIVGVGRWLGARGLVQLRRRTTWPTGFLGAVAVLILLAAAAAEAAGVHAFFGAFLAGVALSGHDREHREAHEVTSRFALGFFAPIYFASIALTTDFLDGFDPLLVVLLVVAACATKVGGVLLGARIAGMPADRTAWAVAWGLNARGATGIVLASVGRASGLIDDHLFVALVLMALVTTAIAGPMMERTLRGRPDADVVG